LEMVWAKLRNASDRPASRERQIAAELAAR
jgi:hypothetical protein